jgi:hypothetical protein
MMATNLFNKEHKATSENYRKGYDRIKWEKDGKEDQDEETDYPGEQ